FRFTASGETRLDGAELGDGPCCVVLLHESPADLYGWPPRRGPGAFVGVASRSTHASALDLAATGAADRILVGFLRRPPSRIRGVARAVEQPMRATNRPDRNLALDLVRVTEAAAMAAGRCIGRGDKNAADRAAVDAMRAMLDTVSMNGSVVIGEGEKDE